MFSRVRGVVGFPGSALVLALASGIGVLCGPSAMAQGQGNVGAGASGGIAGAAGGGSASAGIGGGLMGGGMGGLGPMGPAGIGGIGGGYPGAGVGPGGPNALNRYSADYGYSYNVPTYGYPGVLPTNYGTVYGGAGLGAPGLGALGTPPVYSITTYNGPGYPAPAHGGFGLVPGFAPASYGLGYPYTPVYEPGHHYPHAYFIHQLSFANWCTDIKGIANIDPPSAVFYSAPPMSAGFPPYAAPNPSVGNTTARDRDRDRDLGIDEEPVANPDGVRGLKVARVYPGTAAAKAGLQPGDVIHAVNGYLTQGRGNLAWVVANAASDKVLKMDVRSVRDGQERTVTARIE